MDNKMTQFNNYNQFLTIIIHWTRARGPGHYSLPFPLKGVHLGKIGKISNVQLFISDLIKFHDIEMFTKY